MLACGHSPVRDSTMADSVSSKRTLIRGKSLHESFRGSSIIAECKRKLSDEVFGGSTKMVDSETPNCEQQACTGEVSKEKGM